MSTAPISLPIRAAQVWGLMGVIVLLLDAIVRLAPIAYTELSGGLTLEQLVVLVGVVSFFAVVEGYKGFQLSFAPRLAARLHVMQDDPTPVRLVLAPLFLMALVDATKKRLLVNWMLIIGIVGCILGVRMLPAPYRGIVDAGVVVGLTWGAVSVVVCCWHMRQHGTDVDAELGG